MFHLILVVWLSFIACFVWQHVKSSEQPPIYDAASYFWKAKNFWANMKQPRIANPLNTEPSVRPPGTVLMSYPFGFNPDFHGFYFRSVFIPILCLVFAVYIAGWSSKMTVTRHWSIAIISIFLSTLPLFYHFEFIGRGGKSPVYWGMVDSFFAGVAAVSVAAFLKSITEK